MWYWSCQFMFNICTYSIIVICNFCMINGSDLSCAMSIVIPDLTMILYMIKLTCE